GQPLVSKGIQPPPPEPDGHVSVHPALQTQDLPSVMVRPGRPGPPAGGRHILLGGSYGGTPGRRALASGSGVASARRTRRRVCLPPCGCGGRGASAPRPSLRRCCMGGPGGTPSGIGRASPPRPVAPPPPPTPPASASH